jgi:chemotaxis protein CheD
MKGGARADETGRPTIQIVGIGEIVVSNAGDGLITTHAVGSCIAVCIFDPLAAVAGMLHFLLPDSRVNPARARQQPGAFADTGIPLLFQTAYEYGLSKRRAIVKLVGGAEMTETISATFTTGRRNALAARNLLWRNGVFVAAEDVGGERARSLHLSVRDGRLRVYSGDACKEL